MAYVYGHYTTDGKLYYIGKGTGNRAWKINGRKQYNYPWYVMYKQHGLNCKILYDNLSEEEAFILEKNLIAEERKTPENVLTNITDGGDGFTSEFSKQINQQNVQNPEWIRKNKETREQLKHDLEFHKKVTEGSRKRSQTPEWKRKYVETREQLKHDPEFRKKVTEGSRRRSEDPAYREKMKAVYASPEWIRKNKEVAQKNAQNPEHGKKIKEALSVRWQDPSYREKRKAISDRQKKTIVLESPTGEIVSARGLTEFANVNGLSVKAISAVVAGKQKIHKGWKLPGTIITDTKKCATLISSTGKVHRIRNISEFARSQNITPTKLYEVIRGVRKSHKGWRLYNPEHPINQFIEETSQ